MVSLRVIVAFLFAALLGACDSPRTPLDARDLHIAAEQLESIANEGNWLAQQLQDGAITRNMAWVHQEALGEDAVKAIRKLAKPVPEPLREQHAQLLGIAARLQVQVGRIAAAANRGTELDAVRHELDAAAR